MPVNYVLLGRNIHRLRKEKGWTQEELGRRVRKSTSFIGHVERGTRFASVETLVDIARALETTPDRLLGFRGMPLAQEIGAIRQLLERAAALTAVLHEEAGGTGEGQADGEEERPPLLKSPREK